LGGGSFADAERAGRFAGAFGWAGAFAFAADLGEVPLGLAAAGFFPPRALLASNKPTACSSVIVSGVRSEGSVALTPSWLT
jgi:hypothetical protein